MQQEQSEKALFELSNISKQFPGVKALDAVNFRLFPGEVHALLGENGAGKSTLVKIMTGVLPKDRGSIQLQQQEISPSNTAEAQKLGIAPVYQEVNLLPNLSVAHNLFLGREPTRFGCIRWQQMAEDARQLLKRFKLNIDVTESLSHYSVAIQQLVAIARGVAMNAKVLVLDEPTASLDSSEVDTLFDILRQLKSEGIAILFITHFLEQVYQISDRITVLRSGKLIGEYPIADLSRNRLIEAMLGQELQQVTGEQTEATEPTKREPLLTVSNATVPHSVDDVSLTVHKGEAVGMAGLLGSGRTEVCRALFGIDTLKSGEIKIRQQPVTLNQPADAMQQGIALCPEDRKTDGIIGPLSIRENIALALQVQAGWWRYISPEKQRTLANQYIESFHIATPDSEKPIEELSGGNQQKVILARWLAISPQLLILDEPTRGIDIGAHAEIIKLIKSLCDEGMSLLVASSELDELVAFANRVVVMRDHRKVAELQGAELTSQSIMHSIAEV